VLVIDATVWAFTTALAGVLRTCRTGPEDLLVTVAIVPEAELCAVELERNRKRFKLKSISNKLNENNFIIVCNEPILNCCVP